MQTNSKRIVITLAVLISMVALPETLYADTYFDISENLRWRGDAEVGNVGFTVVGEFPQQWPRTISAAGDIIINIDGAIQNFDVRAMMFYELPILPLRAIGEAIGMQVDFDPETYTAFLMMDELAVTHIIGTNEIIRNDYTITFDVVSSIVDDHTLMPLPMIKEAIGAYVVWDVFTKNVLVNTNIDITANNTTLEVFEQKAPNINVCQEDVNYAFNIGLEEGLVYLRRYVEMLYYSMRLADFGIDFDDVLQWDEATGTVTVTIFDEISIFLPPDLYDAMRDND